MLHEKSGHPAAAKRAMICDIYKNVTDGCSTGQNAKNPKQRQSQCGYVQRQQQDRRARNRSHTLTHMVESFLCDPFRLR